MLSDQITAHGSTNGFNLSKPLLCLTIADMEPLESTKLTGLWPILSLLGRELMLHVLMSMADIKNILHARTPGSSKSTSILLAIQGYLIASRTRNAPGFAKIDRLLASGRERAILHY